MTISFTQYLRPDGRRRDVEVDRSSEIEAAAAAERFVAAGGRYECEVLTTGHASLTAVHAVDGEDRDIAIVLCDQPSVPERVDELVRRSIAWLAASAADLDRP
jgi:hypothetical protein